MLFAFIQGIYLGLGLVMPLGPLNMYIFNSASLQKQFRSVLPILIVACICDSSLILMAVCGVNIITDIPLIKMLIMGVGIAFLFYMSIKMWKTPDRTLVAAQPMQGLSSQITYTASLSLLNPHAILDTFIVIGAVSATLIGLEKHAFTAGCIFSDCAWFIFLATLGFFLHRLKSSSKIFFLIDKTSSLIMFFLAVQLSFDLYQMIGQ